MQWFLAVVFVMGGLAIWRHTPRAQAAAVDKAKPALGYGSVCETGNPAPE